MEVRSTLGRTHRNGNSKRKTRGLSMVEIMVGLAIVAGVMATVASVAISAIDRNDANSATLLMQGFVSDANVFLSRAYRPDCDGGAASTPSATMPLGARIQAAQENGSTAAPAVADTTVVGTLDPVYSTVQGTTTDAVFATRAACRVMWQRFMGLFDVQSERLTIGGSTLVGVALNEDDDILQNVVGAGVLGGATAALMPCLTAADDDDPIGLFVTIPLSNLDVCEMVESRIADQRRVEAVGCHEFTGDGRAGIEGDAALMVCIDA